MIKPLQSGSEECPRSLAYDVCTLSSAKSLKTKTAWAFQPFALMALQVQALPRARGRCNRFDADDG